MNRASLVLSLAVTLALLSTSEIECLAGSVCVCDVGYFKNLIFYGFDPILRS